MHNLSNPFILPEKVMLRTQRDMPQANKYFIGSCHMCVAQKDNPVVGSCHMCVELKDKGHDNKRGYWGKTEHREVAILG